VCRCFFLGGIENLGSPNTTPSIVPCNLLRFLFLFHHEHTVHEQPQLQRARRNGGRKLSSYLAREVLKRRREGVHTRAVFARERKRRWN
jgi:hypothetical protein